MAKINAASEIRPGANRYVTGQHVLENLPAYLADFGNCTIVTGEQSFKIFTEFYGQTPALPLYRYDGTASDENAQALADEIRQTDTIIGIGGGRLLDTAKNTAERLKANFIAIPTLISNCAPYTPIGAIYHPDHTFKRVAYFKNAPSLTLVDWDLLLHTPKDYLIAGIGDTLAKWYEIEALTRNLSEAQKTGFIRIGIATAKEILTILLADADQALQDLARQTVSPAFGKIADSVVGIAGTVGGFAAEYGRMAGAHAVHNGLSHIPATHEILHGAKVAYGILVQLAYTQDFAEIKQLQPFYAKIGLPTHLAQLHVTVADDQDALFEAAQEAASDHESFRLIDPDITTQGVLDAIQAVEKI